MFSKSYAQYMQWDDSMPNIYFCPPTYTPIHMPIYTYNYRSASCKCAMQRRFRQVCITFFALCQRA